MDMDKGDPTNRAHEGFDSLLESSSTYVAILEDLVKQCKDLNKQVEKINENLDLDRDEFTQRCESIKDFLRDCLAASPTASSRQI